MKRLIIIFSMLLPLLSCSAKMPGGPIRAYEYVHNNCTMYPIVSYQIVVDASGVQTLVYSKNDGVEHSVVLQEDALGRIDALTRQYKLYRLKEHYRPPFTVYDGWSWNVHISYERDCIYSSGSNARPSKRLNAGIDAINEYIESLIPPTVG